MLRWIMPCLVAVFAIGTADASDGPTATKRAAHRAAGKLPPACPAPITITGPRSPPLRPLYTRRGQPYAGGVFGYR